MTVLEIPLIETKLHAPRRRPGVVPRTGLDRRLETELPAVVLVSAPAGFGKTTLLTEWYTGFERRGSRVAWVALDAGDSDPAVFWTYVLTSLQRIDAGIGADALARLEAAPTALESVVGSLVNDLAAAGSETVLVLDDYHAIASPDVHRSLLFLIDYIPAHVHLVLASRSDPPWPMGRMRVRGDLYEVRAADLRFSIQEAATYLNDAMGLALTEGDVVALETRTEGWIAALQLAALSLRGREDASGFIAGFAGDDRFVVDYLIDEVLDRQPDDIRSFLLDTSILSRFTASLCDEVTGRKDARAVLDALERSNLFSSPSTADGSGTAITTSSPTRYERARPITRMPGGSHCIEGPANGGRRTATARRRSATPSLPGTPRGRPSSSNSRCRACAGPVRTPPSGPGWMPFRRRSSPTARSSTSAVSDPGWSPATSRASVRSSTGSRAGWATIVPLTRWSSTIATNWPGCRDKRRCTAPGSPCSPVTSRPPSPMVSAQRCSAILGTTSVRGPRLH